ncbi:MAG: glycosyltransferase [Zavarzinia sp.]|nr:glycosyltransferase [Zavarzinia sp.]
MARGLITAGQREAAIDAVGGRDLDPVEALMGLRPPPVCDRITIARIAAAVLDLEFADLDQRPPDPAVGTIDHLDRYRRHLLAPWHQRDDGTLVFACTAPDRFHLALAETLAGGPADLAVATRPVLNRALATRFSETLDDIARNRLIRMAPEKSSGHPAPFWQVPSLAMTAVAIAAGFVFLPGAAPWLASGALALFYLANLVLRLALVVASLRAERAASPPPLPEAVLPLYSVLVPLYQEPEILPLLRDALDRLDYPRALLDVKLVLEADDAPTIAAARALGLDDCFDLVLVPPSQPRTKPKACNYALPLARGDFVVIYDAEDRPESDQLRKAAAALAHAPGHVVCVQARLNFDNAEENWLTRMFALDYALWFDYLLPGLDRLGMPVPLGGTSNHFRRAALDAAGAWDPYNVTEDADLGLRLHALGQRVGIIDSTTFEEATCTPMNWLRQRSRWMKGYMQTFAVQMRDPFGLWRTVGALGFLGVVAFVGGTVASSLLNPVVWLLFALWIASAGSGFLDLLFPAPVKIMGMASWIIGNFTLLYLAMIAPFRRRWFGLSPWAVTVSLYWGMVSVATYRALWQWIRRPFHWEKTRHGLSRHVRMALDRRHGVA